MKTKLLSILFIFFFSFAGYAQVGSDWKWSHPKPQGNDLRAVHMFDNNNWYAFGYSGTFLKTTNAGSTWTVTHKAGLYDPASGNYENIQDAHFFDMNTGVVIGGGGQVSRTTDGGATWTGQVVGTTSVTWYNVYFMNNSIGYVVGTTSGRLAKTTDGGITWTLNTALPTGTYYNVYSADDNTIIVSSTSGNIRRSTDGGVSWTTVLTGATTTLYALNFTDVNNGWAAGSTGKARYTTDAGATWTDVSTGLPSSIFYDIDFHNSAVYLTGDLYDIYKTTDMGVTWTQVEFLGPIANQPWTDNYYASSFFGDRFVTVGGTGLINSVFGASAPVAHTTWMKAGTLYDVWGESSTGRVIAVGGSGNSTSFDQIMYSTNGGLTWTKSTTNDAPAPGIAQVEGEEELVSPAIFRGLDMVSSTTGYIAGQFGAVYKTTNGGVSWDSVATTMGSIYFYDVDFLDVNTGWVVGAAGNCWKTTDGGATWTQQITTLTGIIYSISMANATHGWLVGASGNINATTDGGTTWVSQSGVMGTSTTYGVKAVDASTAYVCGASGKLAKTTDGGALWTLLSMPSEIGTSALYSVDFRGQYGVTCGASGKTASTSDAGASWTFASNAAATNYSVKIALLGTDTAAVYIAGSAAAVHKNSVFIVPVELTSFTSSVIGNTVTLNWTTATEKNNSGFAVERSSALAGFEEIAFVQGNGTTTNISRYSYTDNVQTGNYIYRLKQIDYDGSISYSKEIMVDVSVPEVFALEQNYPNPFNPATVIRYSIPQDGMVTLSVYNILGQQMGTLVNQVQKAGRYEVAFDAAEYSSGIYFYKLESGNFSSAKKMMLTK